jgi:methionyl-tRNA formyltransferase
LETRQAAAEPSVRNARCVLFAYHEMGYACMKALLEMGAPIAALFTHEDDASEEIWWQSCAELARRNSIPVFSPTNIDRQWTGRIAQMRPDVIYSFFYRRLLAEDVLRLAPFGAFNLHASLLPRYRGRAPVNWVLVNGERETGVTLHHMVAEADAGDIVGQRAVSIDDSDTALTLYRKLVPMGAELIREFHPLIVAGRALRLPQDHSKASYVGRRRPEDGRIDWRWPARRIFNLVRAVTHPYPGAFCWCNGRKLFIWQAHIAREHGRAGDAGALINTNAGGIEIAAGEGSIVIERAQFEGGVENSADRVLRHAASGGGSERCEESQIAVAGIEGNVNRFLE